ncbi:alpha/beta-hydrolase [Cryphonectria parasitica EP155]|uniref:Alpha/beta-hydrolase n=1 Tax=Cryphonectria parasitica (strain ATCC 38755 / EP155) TaxID=660469 RepID=A0A9P4YE65_CRYP1|nr:alpha/beta-hydrolase [Cryphonectria parasitica EP155]KAF3770910.1 alpha/beta-hydrolase [Cryphonectria parasitica EP155]
MRLSVASSLSLASGLVAASPLQARDSAVLDETSYENMKYYVQYAASAYCDSEDAVGTLVSCGDSGCPNVTANGATIVGTMPTTTTFDLEGYVAVDPTREEIVVAFRGSSDLRNWIADFDFIEVAYSDCTGCYVHDGFYESWKEIQTYAVGYVEAAYETYPDYTLVITGHSLGAAVATLAGVQFRIDGYPCDIYTVGSPRIGNLAWAEFVTAQDGAEYRATHYDDPVPRLPPIVLGYYHTSPEFWLAAGPATNIDYTIDGIDVCVGNANTSCNAGTTGFDADAHEYYFQYMGCGDESNGIDMRKRNITDAELAQKLTNYTMQDIAFSEKLASSS